MVKTRPRRRQPSSTRCQRCQAAIVFVRMNSGGLMPVDPHPDPLGNVVCGRDEVGCYIAGRIVPNDQPTPSGLTRYMPHWSTCGRPEPPIPAPAKPGPWPPDPLF